MRILHLADLHFRSNRNNYEQHLMIRKMVEHLEKKEKIDFCFFTGDLVFTGNNSADFEEAKALLLDPIIKQLGVSLTNIFICPGNHDVNREECSKAIINYFDKEVSDNDKLNYEYQNQSNDLLSSLKPTKNFFDFLNKYFLSSGDIVTPFYCIYKRTVGEDKVSIICINTAWLSTGIRNDINCLMFPIAALKQAINQIKDSACKILLLHHPLSNLKEFNGIELEDLAHKEFNLMFSGHLHREQISTKFAGNNGIFANTTQATLSFDKGAEIGYSIINYNLDEDDIVIERSFYNTKENSFKDLTPVVVRVPLGIEKANQNKLRRKIIGKFRVEINNSNELMLDYNDQSSLSFTETFTPPVLSTKSETESTSNDSNSAFGYQTLYLNQQNYLLFGKDKCGKTSLLKMIQLYYLKNYSLIGKVPFYCDYKELESRNYVDIPKLIANYFEINNSDTQRIIESGNLVLLIDNLNTYSQVNKIVVSFLESNKNVKFIICSDYLASRIYFEDLDHLEYEKIYFQELSRKEIRLFTEKRKDIKSSEREAVLERITKVCKQLQLPVNYWTVSLILLIYRRSNDDYNKNLFGILDLCVDEILQKRHLALTRSQLTFEQYKEICAKIAHHLLTKHKDTVYSTPFPDLIKFIEEQIKGNPRLVADSKEILDYLLLSGILIYKEGQITFRLNSLLLLRSMSINKKYNRKSLY